MALMDSEESFRKGYKRAGKKTLMNAARTMQIADDDDLKSMTKPEIIEIIENYMGLNTKNKGGMIKSRTGPQDFRKGGMVLSTVDNRRNK
jgi:hypothetical protein